MKVDPWILKRCGGITSRQWKEQKRRELRALKSALETFRMGCAYAPGTDGEVDKLSKSIESLEKAMSIKHWGR